MLILAVALLTTGSLASGSDPASPGGTWFAEEIGGKGVVDNIETVLEIAADGSVSGRGGCNRMSGRAVVAGDRIIFDQLISTQMACVPAVMDQERRFFGALAEVRRFDVDAVEQKLRLLAESGAILVGLSAR